MVLLQLQPIFFPYKLCVNEKRTVVIKTGYLKRSQCCELAILRPFLAIFSQTAVRTFTKVNF